MNDNKPLFEDSDKTAADLFKHHDVKLPKGVTLGKLLGIGFALWCVWALLAITAASCLVYVAWHFISKVW